MRMKNRSRERKCGGKPTVMTVVAQTFPALMNDIVTYIQ